jgi:acetyl esterase/lipase
MAERMTIDRRTLLAAVTASAVTPAAQAQPQTQPTTAPPGPTPPAPPTPHLAQPETIALWPGPAPGSPPEPLPEPDLARVGRPGRKEYHLRGVAAPALFAYRPTVAPNGIALIVMPGGGYSFLSVENEGSAVARRFAELGYTVFVLGYRLPGEGWTNRSDAPIQDAQRAIRLIRAGAKGFGIDPARIGLLGFSAGGHLAASLATGFDDKLYETVDAADAKSARPSFVGLLYPVTTLRPPAAHSGSCINLLGPNPTPELVDRRSPLLHVSATTPPCFLVHALDDKTVDPSCTIDWLAACRAAGVPVEAHMIERGGHGFGVHLAADNPGSRWPDMFRLWAARHGG